MQPLTRTLLPSLRAGCLTQPPFAPAEQARRLLFGAAVEPCSAAGRDCRRFTAAAPSRAGLTCKSLKLAICDAPSEFDEVGVPKPFAIIEKGNNLGRDPDQEETFLSGQCVPQDLGKLPEHKLAYAIDLIGVSHWLRRATYGQTTNFLPVEIGQCNCERDLVVVRYVLRLLGCSRAPEIHSKAVAHVAHRRRLRIAIRADSRDGHIACTVKNREDLLSQGGVHSFTSKPNS